MKYFLIYNFVVRRIMSLIISAHDFGKSRQHTADEEAGAAGAGQALHAEERSGTQRYDGHDDEGAGGPDRIAERGRRI